MNPKDYYRDYISDDTIYPINDILCLEIVKYHPKSVFELGAGSGKNIKLLWKYIPDVSAYGCDLSQKNVDFADKNNGVWIEMGDEYVMQYYGNIDVVFTCSVLDHNEKIDHIIPMMKKMCNEAVILFETNDVVSEYYYSHDYENHGFTKTGLKYKSSQDGALYNLWKWEKEKN